MMKALTQVFKTRYQLLKKEEHMPDGMDVLWLLIVLILEWMRYLLEAHQKGEHQPAT